MINRLTSLRRNWRSLFLPGVIVLYLAFLAVYGAAWALIHRYLWQLDFLSNFTAWYFLPAPILLLVALLLKRRRWAAVLVIPLVIFAVKFGPRFLPRETTASAVSATPTLTVMTMNVLKLNTDWAAIKAQIQAADPDVISLQEMSDAFLTEVWPSLTEMYPYNLHALSKSENSYSGFLSRYPVKEEKTFNLPENFELANIRAVIDVKGQSVVVYTLRLAAPKFERMAIPSRIIGKIFPYQYSAFYRRWQLSAFYPLLAAESLPVLVMGDFNTADSSQDRDTFKSTSGLQDTFAEVGYGMGFTFPAAVTVNEKQLPFVPLMRLDYIWHNSQWQPLSAWLGGSTGSDHLPVVARLKLVE